MSAALPEAHTAFALPAELSATGPAERRGLARSGVRLLVAGPAGITHAHFGELAQFLTPGDLVVINTSATLPAAVDATRTGGGRAPVHFSTELDDGTWVVEVRDPGGHGPVGDAQRGEVLELAGGALLTLLDAHPHPVANPQPRLWRAKLHADVPVVSFLQLHGRPISYAYVSHRWPLSDYQTVFASEAGSAEMPSAGRPFTAELITEMVSRGITVAPIVLHTGVSSLESGEAPQPERYAVPESTAALVRHTRATGGRIVAVGTTVTRALETAADETGRVDGSSGWTDLVLGPSRPARVVDGLITGWHAPQASHLLLLEAVAGAELVQAAYDAAVAARYLWHEFGDSALLLPERQPRGPAYAGLVRSG